MTQEQTNMKDWASAEKEKLDEEKKKRLEDAEYLPFFTIKDGDSVVLKFSDKAPRESAGKYGVKKVFSIKDQNDVEFDYSVNPRSPQYKDIVDNLAQGNSTLRITRVGESKDDTRYNVKPV